jgi:small subunit ribosomal protein S18b
MTLFFFSAYKEAYGDDVVWKHYRRNFKGYWRPDTREKCIVNIVKQ